MRDFVLTAQVLALFVLMVDLVYICVQRSSPAQPHLIILTMSTIIMLTGYLVEILCDDAESALLGTAFSYIGKPFALLSTFLFTAEFCGKRFPKRWVLFHSLIGAAFPVLIFTNSRHHLYYSTVSYVASRRFSGLVLGHGPLYFLYMAYVILNFFFCLFYIIDEFRASRTREVRIQCVYLAGMMLATILGYLFFLTGLTGGYDTTMIGAFIGTLLLTLLFFRYHLFDSLSLAKDLVMDHSNTGYLIVRNDGDMDYQNYAAASILSDGLSFQELRKLPEGNHILNGENDRIYEIQKSHVIQRDRIYGETMEIRDVTDEQNYSNELEKKVESRTHEIKRIQRSIIVSFAGIIDARDNSTGTHIRNMSRYAEIIARELFASGDDAGELSEERIVCLVDVAPLHDIGKLSIPDSILLKPGRLTDEEYQLMKTHSAQGAQIIRECLEGIETEEYVKMAEEVALCHHERWDGKGYPAGLRGTEIPLSARIMAVADVYDAVRSARVYKPPYELAECRNIIEEGSGTQFDPTVVRAFFRAIGRIEQTAE